MSTQLCVCQYCSNDEDVHLNRDHELFDHPSFPVISDKQRCRLVIE